MGSSEPAVRGTDTRTVADLSEDELIASFLPLLPVGRDVLVPSGDDAAVVAAPDGRFCVSTDVLVQDHHFRLGWGDAADVGWRAAMQNLADVAAMGARPTTVVVALVLPRGTPVSWVQDLARGLGEACAPHGVGVDGGDLSAGEQIVVAVTVHGDLGGRDPVLRSGARPGDVLAHCGDLGHAAAGLALLTDGRQEPAELIGRFLRPQPPLAAGPDAARSGATAMMDVSDGLLRDAGRLARSSGVALELEPLSRSVPDVLSALEPAARTLGADATRWVLTGGEDHGMLATFPPDVEVPPGFRVLGRACHADGADAGAVLLQGRPVRAEGWDHFHR